MVQNRVMFWDGEGNLSIVFRGVDKGFAEKVVRALAEMDIRDIQAIASPDAEPMEPDPVAQPIVPVVQPIVPVILSGPYQGKTPMDVLTSSKTPKDVFRELAFIRDSTKDSTEASCIQDALQRFFIEQFRKYIGNESAYVARFGVNALHAFLECYGLILLPREREEIARSVGGWNQLVTSSDKEAMRAISTQILQTKLKG